MMSSCPKLGRSSAVGLAVVLIACSGPPEPAPPTVDVSPPPAAAVVAKCLPPFPMFKPGKFFAADLDQGTTCTAYLERDECIVGIFRDCTLGDTVREWQGRLGHENGEGDPNDVFMQAYYPGSTARPARAAQCCSGTFGDPEGAMPWALLGCRITSCNNLREEEHLGFYLERENTDAVPFGTVGDTIAVDSANVLDFVVLEDRGTGGEIWSLVQGKGLFVTDLASQTSMAGTNFDGNSGEHIAAAPDGTFVIVSHGSTLYRVDSPAAVAGTFDVTDPITAIAVDSSGVLVSTDGAAGARLTLRDPASLVDEIATGSLLGRASVLVGVPAAGFAGLGFLPGEEEPLILLSNPGGIIASFEFSGLPSSGIPLDGSTVGLVGECSSSVRESRCYWEITLVDGGEPEIRRTAIPSGGTIHSAAHRQGDDKVYLAGSDKVHVIDRTQWRPFLQNVIDFEGQIGVVGIGTSPEIYASTGGSIQVIELSQ